MPIKINIGSGVSKILNGKMITETREEFSKKGPLKVKQAIIQDVITGVSPVAGKGKFKKYSEGYKLTIKGEAYLGSDGEYVIFRKVKGKTIPIKVDEKKLPKTKYQKEAKPTKGISPVNLRHTGELHKALKAFTAGGFARTYRLVIHWKHFLADIHNRRGAGKSKVTRRLLPTEQGEKFNRKIMTTLVNELKKAIDKVAKKYS